MGLVPTRDLAQELIRAMGPSARSRTWAISGCHNSCSQPQLADIGIFVSGLAKDDFGHAQPRFTALLRHDHTLLASPAHEQISHADLLAFVTTLS
jgi:sulfite reductase beta subunit-like hemoprotein